VYPFVQVQDYDLAKSMSLNKLNVNISQFLGYITEHAQTYSGHRCRPESAFTTSVQGEPR
jgi:hypothetical protein